MIMAACSNITALAVYVERRGWSLRLGVAPGGPCANKDRPTVLAHLSVYDKRGPEGEEIDTVYFPAKKEPNVNEAAGLLYELVTRTTTPED